MKKFIYTLILVLSATVFTSCEKNTPSGQAEKYIQCLVDKDYAGYCEGLVTKKGALSKEDQKEFEAMCKDKLDKQFESKGGLKSFKVISEEIDESGEKAVVKIESTYGNGSTEQTKQHMKKVDGKWMMDLQK